MKFEFINRTPGNDRLILIFAGWGTGPELYANAALPGWDTLVAYDFDDFEFPGSLLDPYSTVYLFAWSLGVYAAEKSLDPSRLTRAFAVNGTVNPVSDTAGIPCHVFRATADTLDMRNLTKFRLRMAGDRSTFDTVSPFLPSAPDIEALRRQLYLVEETLAKPCTQSIAWRRAYVGKTDRIFPPQNQLDAWQSHPSQPETVSLDAPHIIDMASIIRSVVHDTAKVGERFRRASRTYDDNAPAQRAIALRLTAVARDAARPGQVADILEIGAGTGMFSRMYAPALSPGHITYIDLYPLPQFALAAAEQYVAEDAEKWIRRQAPQSFDMIVSASAMQWFAHPARFLAEAFRCLRPGGWLVCSSFIPGNLAELDALRPSPMLYLPEHELRYMLRQAGFTPVNTQTEEMTVTFTDARSLLLHLKHTGVGGSAATGRQGSDLARTLRSAQADGTLRLTYRPVYIQARRPL